MRENWLNIFFHFSGKIFQLKQSVIKSAKWYVVLYYALLLFFVELFLAIISLPLYLLVAPKHIQKGGLYSVAGPKVLVQEYVWRRRIGLTTGFGAVAIFLIKIVLVGGISFYLFGAQKLLADTQNWTFGTPTDYIYNSSTVEIFGGAAQLKDIGSTVSSSTIYSDFSTNTAWVYADWTDPANVVVDGTRQNSGGNSGAYVDVNIAITGSATQNRSGAGYWEQRFVTNVASPATATLNLNWKSVTYTSATAPDTYQLYAFIETATGVPGATSTAVWNSGEIRATSTWISIPVVDISSKIPTARVYYLKITAYATSHRATGNFTYISGFDNVIVNWSKTTHIFATSSPSTTPLSSLSAPQVSSWNGFTETATKNGGEITYQLSDDDGATWKFWNGSAWAVAGATNFSTATVVNANISSFVISTHQIKWRSFFVSDGSQQVKLSSIAISYTQNNPPQITGLVAAQDVGTGNVHVDYNLQDADSDPQLLVNFEYSLTGAFSGEQVTMVASTTDSAHSGVAGLSSSPADTAHTFAWDARSQLGSIVTSTVFVRLRANDGIASSAFATSSVFSVDYVAPIVSNVSAIQATGTTLVNISYDLSDNATSGINVSLEISGDSGSTWDVPVVSLTGNVGGGQTSGAGKTITWNAGTDFVGHSLSTMQVRVRAIDTWQNQGSFVGSVDFALDALAPTVAVMADLQAQPHAGDGVVLIGGSFTENNPNTNNFYLALDGGDYGVATAGDVNTAAPAAQNTSAGGALKGNNYISKIKIIHTDDFGQTVANENTSPAVAFKFVKPYTPPAPVVNNPGESRADVQISKNTNETDALEYAIFETSQNKYVQVDGTLGASAVWQQIGTGSGQWGGDVGVTGRVVVIGLSSPISQYSFAVKSRNTADLAHAATSESDLSPAAGISNTAANLSIIDVNQQVGNSYALIHYVGSDAQNDTNNLVAFEYSIDAVNWFSMTEKSGVGSSGTGPLSFSAAGASFVFAWDIASNLPDVESNVARIRLKSNDGLLDSNLAESSVFAIDIKAPAVFGLSAAQLPGSSMFNFTYNLADNSSASNTVQLEVSNDSGSSWSIPITSASGDVGGNVSAGLARSISWNAASDYPNAENGNFKIKVKATDRYGNAGSFEESALFTVDSKGPVASSVTAMVNSTNQVIVSYDLADITITSNTVEFQVSDDNGLNWNVATATRSGDIGSGRTVGAKTFIWDAPVDFAGHSSSQMKVRVRATDYFGNVGDFAASAAFVLDTSAPTISNLTAAQIVNSTTVRFNYDLSDDGANVSVAAIISSDSGSTWVVATGTLTGDTGSSVSVGNGKTITWHAGTDFGGQESDAIRIRLQATDNSGNSGALFESADFSVDTLGPVALANFRKFAFAATSVTMAWDSGVLDAHFDHYELWYGSSESDVNNRNGSASRWGTAQDSLLSSMLTVVATISGLNITTNFFVKIFAVDQFGNESTLPAINVYSPAAPEAVTPAPAVSGGAAIPVSVAPGRPLLFSLASPSNKLSVTIAGLATLGTNIDVYDNGNFVGRLNSPADGDGHFSQNISLTEGTHILTVKAVDDNDNAGGFSEAITLVIDTTAPAQPIIFSPAADSIIGEAKPIIIGGAEQGNILNIILDGTARFTAIADANGAWQFILPSQFALANGRHEFVLTSADQAGNESGPTSFVLTKATVPGIVPVAGSVAGQFPLLTPAVIVQPTPTAALVQQNIEATQLASMLIPKINTSIPATDGGNFVFSGTALPNQDVLVYLHSSQALIYRTHSDSNGNWQITHSQQTTELTPGDHSIFAVSIDPANKVKSRPSAVHTFSVKKNFWVNIFTLLNLETTALSLVMLGFVMLWLYRIRVKVGAEI